MNPYIHLTKQAIENYIKKDHIIDPTTIENLPAELFQIRAGVFVVIHKNRKEKSRAGTYIPTRPTVAEEIVRNAIIAVTNNRKKIIKERELNKLSYKVYVLDEPEPVNNTAELNPREFGVIVKTIPFVFPNQNCTVVNKNTPIKSAVLFPNLDNIDTVDQQIIFACKKGGINPNKEKIYIYRFSVKKYED